MNYYPYNSRNTLYREKIGALAEGETLRLKVLLHKAAQVHNVYLMWQNDADGSITETEMTAADWLDDYRYYVCDVELHEGLFWYGFRYTSNFGEFFVVKTEDSLGVVSAARGAFWQQTVYSKDYKTPDWLDGGIIYQIFPDRFAKSGKIKQNVPSDRFICDDWGRQPEFRQPKGEKCRLGNDYYGGDFKGIEAKLDYIKSLGVNCIYLNPIFEAHSNHRYNTADYLKVDSLLGTEEDFCDLIKSAKEKGIEIILDGVFSHTGDDSVYFNRYGRYDSLGAYQSKESPYYKWFNFKDYPNDYESWWGILTLPETNENEQSFTDFITGENGVIRYWMKKGIKGWRLDVADELPDEFLDNLRGAVKSEGEDKFLLGEVWEDASNKISYGKRRRFLRGKQLDSVMNYPFANAIVDFLKGASGKKLLNTVLSLTENYPPQALRLLMNHIGTHDTERILTRLGRNDNFVGDREWQSRYELSEEQYRKAVKLLKLAAVLQYTLPGVPSLYYGDEAGITGFSDPFCRATYPWGNENTELLDFYKKLGGIRRGNKAFAGGEFIPEDTSDNAISYMRYRDDSEILIAVNKGEEIAELNLPNNAKNGKLVFGDATLGEKLVLPPLSFAIIVI